MVTKFFFKVPNPPDEVARLALRGESLRELRSRRRKKADTGLGMESRLQPVVHSPSGLGSNIIRLRQLLKEKFPGLRTNPDEFSPDTRTFWPTSLPQIDTLLHGGFAKGALTEIVSQRRAAGSALLACSLLRQAAQAGQIVAFVDGADSLEVTQLEETVLSRLLWVRCRSAAEALKATDLLLRDGNVPLVLLDIAINPAKQLRAIPATTWYRLQRLIEETSTVCVAFTPRVMVSPAHDRIFLQGRFSLSCLDQDQDKLLNDLKLEAAEMRRFGELDAKAS